MRKRIHLFLLSLCILLTVMVMVWYIQYGQRCRISQGPLHHGVLIAHALGEIDGYTYTNSRDAFLYNYGKGKRVFEMDITTTGDGHLVCFHTHLEKRIGLNRSVSETPLKEFLQKKYKHRYPLMTLKRFFQEMKDHDDSYLVTDTKTITRSIITKINKAIKGVDPSLASRIFIQYYKQEDLKLLNDIQDHDIKYAGLIFTIYQVHISDKDLVEFVRKHHLTYVTMPPGRMNKDTITELHRACALVFTHTVNDPKKILSLLDIGCDGFYTDSYMPSNEYIDHMKNSQKEQGN